MLGRYIAGTCLVLGVAMVVTPNTRDRDMAQKPQVTRAETAVVPFAEAEPVRVSQSSAAAAASPALSAPTEPGVSADDSLIAVALQQALEAAPEDGDGTIGGIASLAGLEQPPAADTASAIGSTATSSASYTDLSAPADRTGAADLNMVMFISGSRVNVRSGPSTDYSVISSVQYGDAVELVSYKLGGWAEIRIDGLEENGYVSDRFLTESLNGG